MKKVVTLVVLNNSKMLHIGNEGLRLKPKNAQLVQEFEVDKVLISI